MFRSPRNGSERNGDNSNTSSSNTIVCRPPPTPTAVRRAEDLVDLARTTVIATATATSTGGTATPIHATCFFSLLAPIFFTQARFDQRYTDLAGDARIWPAARGVRGRTITDGCKGLEALRPAAGPCSAEANNDITIVFYYIIMWDMVLKSCSASLFLRNIWCLVGVWVWETEVL
jgi:hypothetical protein